MQKWLLPAIIFIAFLLRVVAIDKYPVGLNPDEASFGYDAYSLLQTGRDQWGHVWPLSLQSFGDYKLPLYSYLAIPFVANFGLNEFSTRLPNALFGVLGVFGVFLLVYELFKSKKLALTSSLFLAISPWHIMLSRGAFEANLATSFLPYGVWLFLKGLKDGKWMVWSAVVFGFSLFSYHSARLVTPLIVLTLLVVYRNNISLKKYGLPALIFIIFSLVAGWTLMDGGTARGSDVAIFNPTDRGQAIFERRNTGFILGLPDQVSRIFSNKYMFTFDEFIKNYTTYFSPQFLFTQGPTERTYGMIPGVGVMYLTDLLFIAFFAFTIIRNREVGRWKFLLIWLFLAPVPAALAKGGGFAANRAAIMIPILQIISAFGFIQLWENFKKIRLILVIVLTVSFVIFLENYIYHAPSDSAQSMMYGRREMVLELKKIESQYDQIIVSRSLSEPHIYFAFYNLWDTKNYQGETKDWLRYRTEGRSFIDQLGEYHLGKYIFTNIDFEENSKRTGILMVGKPEEFPRNIIPFKSISTVSGKPQIIIVDPESISYAKVI